MVLVRILVCGKVLIALVFLCLVSQNHLEALVSCGGHDADTCHDCAFAIQDGKNQAYGEPGCNGVCKWVDNDCISETDIENKVEAETDDTIENETNVLSETDKENKAAPTNVSCGGHDADTCHDCAFTIQDGKDQAHGESGCGGVCKWVDNDCLSETDIENKVEAETNKKIESATNVGTMIGIIAGAVSGVCAAIVAVRALCCKKTTKSETDKEATTSHIDQL